MTAEAQTEEAFVSQLKTSVDSLTEAVGQAARRVQPVSDETLQALETASTHLTEAATSLNWHSQAVDQQVWAAFARESRADETGTLQSAVSVADYADSLRSLGVQELLIESCTQQRRQTDKLRQLENAVHFLERRQDAAASLPSEVARHYHVLKLQTLQAEQPHIANQARQEWHRTRQDAAFVGFQGGCLRGLVRAVWLHSCMKTWLPGSQPLEHRQTRSRQQQLGSRQQAAARSQQEQYQ